MKENDRDALEFRRHAKITGVTGVYAQQSNEIQIISNAWKRMLFEYRVPYLLKL